MDRNAVIIVTGAAGFIGSCLTGYLNRKGYFNIIIVDDFNDLTKKHNYDEKKICARVDKEELFDWLNRYKIRIDFVFHLGAYIQAGKQNSLLEKINTDYSKDIWNYCTDKMVPLIYTSFESSQPKNDGKEIQGQFDQWVIKQYNEKKLCPPFWAGLNLSQVYGPNEYHKGSGASLVFRFFEQMNKSGKVTLQKSANDQSTAGEQNCDFVYVKDVVDVCYWMMQKSVDEHDRPESRFYDVGSGFTHSQVELAGEVFKNSGKEPVIEYVIHSDVEPDGNFIRVADISRLREAGYRKEFYSLAEGVKTYVTHFLAGNKYY